MQEAYIVDAVRTPVGKFGGSLSSIRIDDLAAMTIKKILERNPTVNNNEIDDVILGSANQAGEDNRNLARMALLLARLLTSAMIELEIRNKRYALCTMCIGVGQGYAVIIERV